jgi:hypothetical protein
MNSYEAKVAAARLARLRARAAARRAEGTAAVNGAHKMAAIIPFGQPILVGHHSERRDRRYRDRIDGRFRKGFEALAEARELDRRADAAETNTAISSDDPEALDKLRAKLAEHERQHAALLDANKRLRAGASVDDVEPLLDFWSDAGARLRILMSMGHRTIPLGNSSAEGRRIRERIGVLERARIAPPREPEQFGSIRLEESDNRVRLIFSEKPSNEVRATLKSRGFRWSPAAGAWQRQATPSARHDARDLARKITES